MPSGHSYCRLRVFAKCQTTMTICAMGLPCKNIAPFLGLARSRVSLSESTSTAPIWTKSGAACPVFLDFLGHGRSGPWDSGSFRFPTTKPTHEPLPRFWFKYCTESSSIPLFLFVLLNVVTLFHLSPHICLLSFCHFRFDSGRSSCTSTLL